MIKKIKISALDIDYSIYPRERMNPYHVEELVEAIKAGVNLPPIRVDKATLKVVDGWHRIEAIRKLEGDKAKIDAELVEYGSVADMFQDAIRLNASHGQSLSKMDEAHCLSKAEEFHLEQAVIATLLNITTERAAEIVSNRLAISDTGSIVLKGSTAHLAGRRLTQEQENYNRNAGGMHQSFYINQVIAMVESDSVDWDDARVVSGLKKLEKLLESSLKAVA
jgi:hypothetical protein